MSVSLRNSGMFAVAALAALILFPSHSSAASPAATEFRTSIQPILSQYCFDCHADGVHKGEVALDQFKSDEDLLKNPELWFKVLKNVRSGIMPPQKKPHPDEKQKQQLVSWIKYGAFGLDPKAPDPGRVTVRRLNRVEYRNTVRDLMGFDFNATEEFPPDDTGYGFDTIGEVLSVSPMLLEKYMQAAEVIANAAVPTVAKVVAETSIPGSSFRPAVPKGKADNGAKMSFYKVADVGANYSSKASGRYRVVLNLVVRGAFNFDPGRCELAFMIDGVEKWKQQFKWENGQKVHVELDEQWDPARHKLSFHLRPLVSADEMLSSIDMQITTVDVLGPLDPSQWVAPKNYHRFFPREAPPKDPAERNAYAREVLGAFATKAFRRPVEPAVLDRLVKIAEVGYATEGKGFEESVRQAIVAVLASPRFLFRIEQSGGAGAVAAQPGRASIEVDEYALASKLSYFLWSSMPDDTLMAMAQRRELRKNLGDQVKRMLADPRSQALVQNFAGQWLELRDVGGVSINVRVVFQQDMATTQPSTTQPTQSLATANAGGSGSGATGGAGAGATANAGAGPQRGAGNRGGGQQPQQGANGRGGFGRGGFGFFRPPVQFDAALRDALRREPEMLFDEVIHEDRSVSELLDNDHTYVNDVLAKLYNIPGVVGTDMRRVELAKDSPRGGLLTTAAVLAVTSNPTRTSPVKRGQFILDNILGMPAPAPPPNIPALEESEKSAGKTLSFREVLELHRSKALCRSCHARMDPLGLSLENFNALGAYREKERGLPIDASGQLLTGETFRNARDIKTILKKNHTTDFYRCLAEKMLTYALGRGLDYHDVETVDQIVDRMNREDGRFSALLSGIVESAPFQRRRLSDPARPPQAAAPQPQGRVTTSGTP